MRTLSYTEIVDAVSALCRSAAIDLPADVSAAMEAAHHAERSEQGRKILESCLQNARLAADSGMPICQDTGISVLFVELGEDLRITGGRLTDALQAGIARGHREHFLRASIVDDPLFDRTNTGDNTPAVVHLELVPGDSLHITLAPKGGGSENWSATRMLKPADGRAGVVTFVIEAATAGGGNPCPPVIVGVGIGGTIEACALLAKKALLRKVGTPHPDPRYCQLEAELLDSINASGIGPQGLGGVITALAVHIETRPCHIASLPVAVALNCHVARHASVVL